LTTLSPVATQTAHRCRRQRRRSRRGINWNFAEPWELGAVVPADGLRVLNSYYTWNSVYGLNLTGVGV